MLGRSCSAWAFFVLLLLWTCQALALGVPPLAGRVNDTANILSDEVEKKLTAKLADVEQRTGHQLAILTVASLEGDPIEDFGIRVVEAWKLGQKGKDDGVLLLVAAGDHKMRIEVGYGLEGELPDAAAGRIIQDVMIPRFRQGDYDGGVTAAVSAILVRIGAGTDEDKSAVAAAPSGSRSSGSPLGSILRFLFLAPFLFFFLVVIVLRRLFGGGSGSRSTYYGGSSFGGSSSGGGSSFSGGGGSFGGGGASGSW
jgi:uncharacterized protein